MNILSQSKNLQKKVKQVELFAFHNLHSRKLTQSNNRKLSQQKLEISKTHRRLHSEQIKENAIQKRREGEKSKFINYYLKNITNNSNSKTPNKLYKIMKTQPYNQDSPTVTQSIKSKPSPHPQKQTISLKKISRESKTSIRKLSNIFPYKDYIINTSYFDNYNKYLKSSESYQNWKIDIIIICKCLQQLSVMDTNYNKINKICYKYFQKKNKNITEIFIHEFIKKKSLNDEIGYIVIKNQNKLINKVSQILQIMDDKQKHLLGIEITMYKNFLEKRIASKHKQELDQLQNKIKCWIRSVQMKKFAKKIGDNICTSSQLSNFYNEFERLEDIYGKLNLVTMSNRKRYQNLHNSQINIMNLIHG